MDLLPELLGVAVDRVLTVGSLVCADLGHGGAGREPSDPTRDHGGRLTRRAHSGNRPRHSSTRADQQETGQKDAHTRSVR